MEIKLFTIGFTKKSAEKFFNLLKDNNVKKIIDIRLKNQTQLSGFSKGSDLNFFASKFYNIDYVHIPDFAPSKEILTDYRKKKIKWDEYEIKYLDLIRGRKVENILTLNEFDNACILCSEDKPEKCHRRLLAEYLKEIYPSINIIHII